MDFWYKQGFLRSFLLKRAKGVLVNFRIGKQLQILKKKITNHFLHSIIWNSDIFNINCGKINALFSNIFAFFLKFFDLLSDFQTKHHLNNSGSGMNVFKFISS